MAEHGKLQTNLEYWLARIVIGFLAALPLSLAIRLGSKIGQLGGWMGKLRRTGGRNLELAFPELSADEREKLLRGSFKNLGRLLGVFSHFRDSTDTLREKIELRGMEHIEAALREKRGIIAFTGHVGGWELSSFAPSLYGQPFSFLVRRIDNPKIEALVEKYRVALGNSTIDKRLAAREMVRILRNGEMMGILVDLNALDREAIFVDFFGVKAATTFVVAKLAVRTGAAIVPIFSPWDEASQKFVVEVGAPLQFDLTGDEAEDTRRVTQLLTNVIEDRIRRYPDQWLWVHRRWKTRPPGEPAIY